MNTALLGSTPRALLAATICVSFATAIGGCGKVEASASGPGNASNQAVGVAAANAVQVAATPVYENANYKAQLRGLGACKKDETCTAEVVVEAKGDYHINDKYPYRFKTEDPPPQGMKYPKAVVGKEDGTMEERKVTLKVPFVAGASGDAKISGTLSLSVCSAANCLMDKQPLEVAVKVE